MTDRERIALLAPQIQDLLSRAKRGGAVATLLIDQAHTLMTELAAPLIREARARMVEIANLERKDSR